MQGQIPGMTSTGFMPASGWQGAQPGFQQQYPGYAQQQPAFRPQQASFQQQQPSFQAGYQQQQPGYPQQQPGYHQQQQQMLLQRQAQLAQEHQERELEERRQRELEKQKHRLKSINVTKPRAVGSNLESLIGLSLVTTTASSKPKPAQSTVSTVSAGSDKSKPISQGPVSQGNHTLLGSETGTGSTSSAEAQGMGRATPPTNRKQHAVTTSSGLYYMLSLLETLILGFLNAKGPAAALICYYYY